MSKDFHEGARAMFDWFQIRAANNWHGNPDMDAICDKENELVLKWAEDALDEVSPETSVNWKELDSFMKELHDLRQFHSFFKDRCEGLFFHFGPGAIRLYNAACQPSKEGEFLVPMDDRSHKQVIVIRKDLNMRKGKIAAQAAHASMAAVLSRAARMEQGLLIPMDDDIGPWLSGRFTKVCVYVESEIQLKALHVKAQAAGLPCALIEDSGLTEFHGVPTLTALAVGPADKARVDAVSGDLPLL